VLLVETKALLHRTSVGRDSGPSVPALRYANLSKTGKSARASSNVT